MKRKCVLLLVLSFSSSAAAQATWTRVSQSLEWKNFVAKCSEADKDACGAAISMLLEKGPPLWAQLTQDFRLGLKHAQGELPIIEFSPKARGELKLELDHQAKMDAVLSLKTSEGPWGLLLTLSREMHHYANTMKGLSSSQERPGSECLDTFEHARLKEATDALKKEISFWEESPSHFKHLLSTSARKRPLFQDQNLSYGEYYKMIREKIEKDSRFVVKRQVELGLSPSCALSLFP